MEQLHLSLSYLYFSHWFKLQYSCLDGNVETFKVFFFLSCTGVSLFSVSENFNSELKMAREVGFTSTDQVPRGAHALSTYIVSALIFNCRCFQTNSHKVYETCCDATCMIREPGNTSRQVLAVTMFKRIHVVRAVSESQPASNSYLSKETNGQTVI